MAPSNYPTNDEEAPLEDDPLLRDKKNNRRNPQSRSMTLPVLLFGVAAIVFLAHVASIKGNRKSSFSTPDQDDTKATDQWWQESIVTTTNTHLPGFLPQENNLPGQRKPRWGVLGLGRIARDFTTALKMSGASIVAVAAGSHNATLRAKAFAETYKVQKSYGSYQELAEDPNVDIVYVATINTGHYRPAMMMLKAGKNVLIEKPMTLHLDEANLLASTAKEANLLLMTNYWCRFFPVMKSLRSVLTSERLGPISSMRGDFGFPMSPNKNDRYLNRQIGGGAMLDLGCYLVNLALMVYGQAHFPSQVQAMAQRSYLGTNYNVDTEIAFQLGWNEAQIAPLNQMQPMVMSGQASLRRPSSFEVEIDGRHGRVVIHGPANAATAATIYEYEPMGPLKRVEQVHSELPTFDDSFGPESYPRGEGFVYIIHDIERCMMEHGIPGDRDLVVGNSGCTELKELTIKEQLMTVEITETVLREAGYWDWDGGL